MLYDDDASSGRASSSASAAVRSPVLRDLRGDDIAYIALAIFLVLCGLGIFWVCLRLGETS